MSRKEGEEEGISIDGILQEVCLNQIGLLALVHLLEEKGLITKDEILKKIGETRENDSDILLESVYNHNPDHRHEKERYMR